MSFDSAHCKLEPSVYNLCTSFITNGQELSVFLRCYHVLFHVKHYASCYFIRRKGVSFSGLCFFQICCPTSILPSLSIAYWLHHFAFIHLLFVSTSYYTIFLLLHLPSCISFLSLPLPSVSTFSVVSFIGILIIPRLDPSFLTLSIFSNQDRVLQILNFLDLISIVSLFLSSLALTIYYGSPFIVLK